VGFGGLNDTTIKEVIILLSVGAGINDYFNILFVIEN